MHRLVIPFILMASCGIFSEENLYKKGIASYEKKEYEKAIRYFTLYYQKVPTGDSTLFFLYNCYLKINDHQSAVKILEELARRGHPDENIYINLYHFYQRNNSYDKMIKMLLNTPPDVMEKIDLKFPLTRRRVAELFAGIFSLKPVSDPINFVLDKGFMKPAPDGKFYENDTVKIYHLILFLDSYLPPVTPQSYIYLKNIKPDSYLYLPCSRLVSLGILELDENIDPEARCSLSQVLRAIMNLKNKGYIK
ncbi:MAG: hypothetical protein N3A65_02420 [candidate division WOR-3 bacterium]|nr:hypothetical protein [candidate division WOR-3 bacterium]